MSQSIENETNQSLSQADEATIEKNHKRKAIIIILSFLFAMAGFVMAVPVTKILFNEKQIVQELSKTLKETNLSSSSDQKKFGSVKNKIRSLQRDIITYSTFITLIRTFFMLLPIALISSLIKREAQVDIKTKKKPISVKVLAIFMFIVGSLFTGFSIYALISEGLKETLYVNIALMSFFILVMIDSFYLFKMKKWSANLFLCAVSSLFFFYIRSNMGDATFDRDIVELSIIFAVFGAICSIGLVKNYSKFT